MNSVCSAGGEVTPPSEESSKVTAGAILEAASGEGSDGSDSGYASTPETGYKKSPTTAEGLDFRRCFW